MSPDELQFLEDCLAANELRLCLNCGQQTLHAHLEVVEVQLVATELLMECTHCATVRRWLDWDSPQLARN
jgi:hypothetical protein